MLDAFGLGVLAQSSLLIAGLVVCWITGGLLAMLTNSLIPFAYERGKSMAVVATVVGFCLTMLNT